jgi:hypothetical protein
MVLQKGLYYKREYPSRIKCTLGLRKFAVVPHHMHVLNLGTPANSNPGTDRQGFSRGFCREKAVPSMGKTSNGRLQMVPKWEVPTFELRIDPRGLAHWGHLRIMERERCHADGEMSCRRRDVMQTERCHADGEMSCRSCRRRDVMQTERCHADGNTSCAAPDCTTSEKIF